MELIAGLNQEQREAVLHTEGPLLILAGAGSGKTRVLTHRIAYLINEKHIYPSNILAITFTNKAAKEMKERVKKIIGDDSESIWMGTFHAICIRILRKHIEKIGFDKSFVVFDASDQKSLVTECIKELQVNEKNYPARTVMDEIGKAKDNLMTPDTYLRKYSNDFRMHTIAKIYALYQKKLKANNALDFDDIIHHTIQILNLDTEVLTFYQNKFRYIHVDEYQDTNNAQYTLITLLSGGYRNLCVVGDDDQSIYGWRGANIRNILDFEKEYKECRVIKLEQNYRSTAKILDAANHVIQNNTGRKSKKLWTSNANGEMITRYFGETAHQEAYFVADKIQELRKTKDLNYSDFAILYRTNAQSRVFEEIFMKEGLPYKIVGGLKFYDRKEIKDLIAYLRMIANPVDNFSLKRVINVPKRGIGNATLEAAERLANQREVSLFTIIATSSEYPELKRAAAKLSDFTFLINKLRAFQKNLGLTDFIGMVLESTSLLKDLEEDTKTDNEARIENLQEFKSVAKEFEHQYPEMHLSEFLEHISLVTDLDTVDEQADNIFLMTMHSAKGLEYPVIFMVGAEEGVFPSYRSLYDENELEEERRLCYVAITRAREKLFISHCFSRTLYGNTTYNKVSRFIEEIPEELVEFFDGRFGMQNRVSPSVVSHSPMLASGGLSAKDFLQRQNQQMGTPSTHVTSVGGQIMSSSQTPALGNSSHLPFGLKPASAFIQNQSMDSATFKVGDTVAHKKFGIGVVTSVEPENSDFRLEIDFRGIGMKRLMASFANLSHV